LNNTKNKTNNKNGKIFSNILKDSSFPAFIVLVLLIIINATLQPEFFSSRVIKINFMTYTPLILAAIAQGIIIISGSIDLSLGASMSLFTVLTAFLMTDTNFIWIILLGFVTIMVISGLLNGTLIGRVGLSPLITTYATSSVFLGIAMLILPYAGGYVPKFVYSFYKSDVLKVIPAPVFILIIGICLWYLISRTTIYRYIYAIGSNQDGAYASGINVSNVRLAAHILASIFIAMAGLCILLSTATGDFRSGIPFALNSIAAVVIGGISLSGGKGNIWGAIIGALILGLLNNIIFFARISSLYQIFAKGMIIVLALIIATVPKIISGREQLKF
jgi:ribose transport system permease protein